MDCTSIPTMPEEMSRERFEWLEEIGAEVIATPGCESNVKEIYDKCWEIRDTVEEAVILNQFDEFGNAVWHYHVTGTMLDEVFQSTAAPGDRLAAFVSATGSAGTIAAGDFLRTRHPGIRVVATEALQCPTLLEFGFGEHRIEGIGDKHVPWIHNLRNTDVVAGIDDNDCIALMRLFNEPVGRQALLSSGVDGELVSQLQKALPADIGQQVLAANIRDDGELVVLTGSPAWAAKLRFEADALLGAARQTGADVHSCTVRVSRGR